MLLMLLIAVTGFSKSKKRMVRPLFPDGTPIPAWFSDTTRVDVASLGRQYVVTDYGVKTDSTLLQT